MNKFIVKTVLLFICLLGMSSCGEKNVQPETGLNFLISLQKEIQGAAGDPVTLKFYSGKGPQKSDQVVLKGTDGKEIVCGIISVTSETFSFEISPEIKSGKYGFYIRRGGQMKKIGDVQFIIEYREEIQEKEGFNIYGIVKCGDEGVPGVVVSDGKEVTLTDEKGVYYLKSDEYNKVVFMSVPSGYEAVTNGVLPEFHKLLDGDPKTTERADFTLAKVNNDSYVMYVLGDMHLANRTSDLSQFSKFTSDLMAQVNANSGKRQYALTLGDMSWDLYWISNKYDLYNYIGTLQKSLSGLSVFHTIGNHDHDMAFSGDYNTVDAYKKAVGPTYYSFNIGNEHYIVLDNILCTNDGNGGRSYTGSFTTDQLSWLRKDLEHVDKSRKLVVAMHAHMYEENGTPAMDNTSVFEQIVDGYEVHVLSAHTHVIWNNDLKDKKIYHHNSGAVCATWWWTGHLSDIHLCKDGAPGGYYIYNVNEGDIKWNYKATGKDLSYQFRTYDRNSIKVDAATFASNANASNATKFNNSAAHWNAVSTDNYVYFNIWDYDPSWEILVTEGNETLKWEKVNVKDPLHLVSYEARRYNSNATPTSSFVARSVGSHMFRVKASSATSTLEFKVTDRFGTEYTETMKRPKAFSINAYK